MDEKLRGKVDTLFGLPAEVRFCNKCVISNQRPRSTVEFGNTIGETKATIEFENDGICEACKFNEEKSLEIDWDEKEARLLEVLDKHRRSSGYDVIVPGSGGKDSAYTAHVLKEKYGMNPLTVTWAPHLYTEIGWENFTNWSHIGGLDNILFTPNGKLHRILTKEAFLNLLHPFQPFIVGQRIIGPLLSKKFGVPLVMYGENQAEYGNAKSENKTPLMNEKFFKTENDRTIRLGGREIPDLIKEYNLKYNEFEPYLPLNSSEQAIQTEVHYLGYYLKWDPQECYYYAVENTGFKPAPERTEGTYSKYSSIDDKIDPFHYYTTYIKFGLGRASYDAAQEIRNGKITRDEGVALVKQFDAEFPSKYFEEFCEYINISRNMFEETIDRNRSPHLWDRKGNDWEIKHAVWK
jgi:N-acetyl sugar amidotransferase